MQVKGKTSAVLQTQGLTLVYSSFALFNHLRRDVPDKNMQKATVDYIIMRNKISFHQVMPQLPLGNTGKIKINKKKKIA